MRIRNVIAIIKGAEEPDRYCAAILVIRPTLLGNVLSFCRMSMQERVDFWNSFLTQKCNKWGFAKMLGFEAWVFSHLQWETIADMHKWSCFPCADILYMHMGQVHNIRKSPWCLGFWCCGSPQWNSITSRGLASQGISYMSLWVAHLSILVLMSSASSWIISLVCLVLTIKPRLSWDMRINVSDKLKAKERRGILKPA